MAVNIVMSFVGGIAGSCSRSTPRHSTESSKPWVDMANDYKKKGGISPG